MILPNKRHIKQLTVADVHTRCRHAGVKHVLAQVRNRCWIIDGRQEAKNLDKECKVCERRRVQPSVQIMALLPRTRVGTTMRAFPKCCVDYASPFTTKITLALWELQKEILNEKFWPQQTETEFFFPREVCEVNSKPLLSSHLYIDTCWVYTKLIWSPKPLEQVNHFTVKLKTLIWVFEIIKVLNMAMRMNCVIL